MNSTVEIDPRIKKKSVRELLDLPVTVRVSEFNDEAVIDFIDEMEAAHQTGQPIIPIVIDSYGGQVYSLLSMVSVIENARLPVATICMGKAMSCGSILLSCGAEGHRYIDANAHVMIHDVSSMQWGKNEELKASAKQTDKLQKQIFKMLAKNCGQDSNYFLNIIHEKNHAEWYMGAVEAKKHNIANHIKTPKFEVNISVDMNFV